MCRAEVSVNSVGSLLVAAGQWQQRDRGVWATVQFAFFRCSANRRTAACRYCCTATQAWRCQRRHPSHLTAAPAPPRCCMCGLQEERREPFKLICWTLRLLYRLCIRIIPGGIHFELCDFFCPALDKLGFIGPKRSTIFSSQAWAYRDQENISSLVDCLCCSLTAADISISGVLAIEVHFSRMTFHLNRSVTCRKKYGSFKADITTKNLGNECKIIPILSHLKLIIGTTNILRFSFSEWPLLDFAAS